MLSSSAEMWGCQEARAGGAARPQLPWGFAVSVAATCTPSCAPSDTLTIARVNAGQQACAGYAPGCVLTPCAGILVVSPWIYLLVQLHAAIAAGSLLCLLRARCGHKHRRCGVESGARVCFRSIATPLQHPRE